MIELLGLLLASLAGVFRRRQRLQARPHQGLKQRRPWEPVDVIVTTQATVERRDRLGGLIHEYNRAA